jgi:hypothetical protein
MIVRAIFTTTWKGGVCAPFHARVAPIEASLMHDVRSTGFGITAAEWAP